MANECWIVRLDGKSAAGVARLRSVTGLQIAEGVDSHWLRACADGTLECLLRTVAGERFTLTDDDQLVPWGKRVPVERLSSLDWRPLAEWAAVTLPVAALPAELTSRVRLRLVRGGREQPAAALLTDWEQWFSYATEAPDVRLRPLAFARSVDQRVFIIGSPLPPVAGQSYAVEGGIAVPCGWSITPAVGSSVIRKLVSLEAGDIALCNADGSFERIAAEHFVAASRSAVRATAQGVAHD
jgi:hypothetical protein